MSIRDGPGSTIVTCRPLSPPHSKANGPYEAGAVRLLTPHSEDVEEAKSPALCPTQIWNGESRSWQQSYRL